MNLYDYSLPETGEAFDELFSHQELRIVRIVSSERPDTSLYDQSEDEWVVLLDGEATLEVDGHTVFLRRGETLFLPAHTPHRVLHTTKGSLWLALHFEQGKSETPNAQR